MSGKEFANVVIVKAGARYVIAVFEAPHRLDLAALARVLPEQEAASPWGGILTSRAPARMRPSSAPSLPGAALTTARTAVRTQFTLAAIRACEKTGPEG